MTDSIKVFWCPVYEQSSIDWNLLYYEPTSLLKEINDNKVSNLPSDNFLKCPAFVNEVKNTFVLKNSISSEYKFLQGKMNPVSDSFIELNQFRKSSLENATLMTYKLSWIFFTEEESLDMSLTAPYFSNSPHLRYGSIVPGRFDIGKWFRNVNLEFNLWGVEPYFALNDEEAVGYVQFHTDKKIELVRFTMNDFLAKISTSTGQSSQWLPRQTLTERYLRFKKTKTKEIVLREINKNLV